MKQKIQLLAGALVLLCLTALSASAQTTAVVADFENEDTETKLIDAKVVEITDNRISVFARSGVEHVIEINREETKVMVEGEEVSLKDVREGDLITIELDAQNPVKFAKNISLSSMSEQVARNRR